MGVQRFDTSRNFDAHHFISVRNYGAAYRAISIRSVEKSDVSHDHPAQFTTV
jgi:hypothetical protein